MTTFTIDTVSPSRPRAWRAARLALVVMTLSWLACDHERSIPAVDLADASVRCYTATNRAEDARPSPDGSEVWVATNGGMLRYRNDGSLIEKLTRADGLAAHTLHEIEWDADGSLWVASTRGLLHLADGRWSRYSTRDGLNDNRVYALEWNAEGELLAGTHRGVSRRVDGRFVPFDDTHEFCRRPTYDIHRSGDGTLWFAKENALTQYRGPGDWRVFQRDALIRGPRSDIVANSVLRVVTDSAGHPWVGTANRGLGYFDDRSWSHLAENVRRSSRDGLRGNRIAALTLDGNGDLWVGHGEAGAGRSAGIARLRDDRWDYFSAANGLPVERVHRLRSEHDALWIATSRGAARFTPERSDLFETAGELASNRVVDIVGLGHGRVAVLTAGGLSLFDEGNPVDLPAPPFTDLTTLGHADGLLYAATRGHGLLIYDGTRWDSDPIFRSGPLFSIASHDGEIWIVHPRGVHHGSRGSWTRLRALAPDSTLHDSRIFPGPQNQLWISGLQDERLLARLSAESIETRSVLHQPTQVDVSYADDGTAWLASADGLIDLADGESLSPPALRSWVPRVSLTDSAGRLWVGTQAHGLFLYAADGWKQALIGGELFPREITRLYLEDDRTLWIGTTSEGAFRATLDGID